MLSLFTSVAQFKNSRLITAAGMLTGVLTGALLVFELLAANSGLHQVLHQEGKPASDGCVLCLFAKGQVDLPEPVPVAVVILRCVFPQVLARESHAVVDFAYLVSPSRAPPAPALLPLSRL